MDIALLDKKTLRIKGKNGAILVNPTSIIGKTEGIGAIFLEDYEDKSISKIDGTRIVIKGPGEYEISGIKISTIPADAKLVAKIEVDLVKLLIGQGKAMEKIQEKAEECNIAIVEAGGEFNYSTLTSLEPNILILYGEKKEEAAKSLGQADASKLSKFAATKEKLPSEMQVALLE